MKPTIRLRHGVAVGGRGQLRGVGQAQFQALALRRVRRRPWVLGSTATPQAAAPRTPGKHARHLCQAEGRLRKGRACREAGASAGGCRQVRRTLRGGLCAGLQADLSST